MNIKRLKLNDDNTEFIIIGSNIKKLPQTTININGHTIASSKKVKNLDHDMFMSSHVTQLFKKLYF